MRRKYGKKTGLLGLLVLLLALAAQAQKPPDERRLLRIESRVYGWYGVAEPEFDKTIGRRQLYKINAGEQFLKGLDGRLVILEGRFSEGQLDMGQLAPPPISVPAGSRRQRFVIERDKTEGGLLTTTDGYLLRGADASLSVPGTGRMNADLVVTPLGERDFQVVGVLSSGQPESLPVANTASPSPPLSANSPLPGGALLEMELTQGFVDNVVDLGRDQAGLKVGFQALSLQVSQLRVILPDEASATDAPWRLEGTVELSWAGTGSLAESSFVVSARPLIEANMLQLEPNWDEIKLEGQLPFAFVLDASMLEQLKTYLPQRLPVLNLEWISSYLRSQGLVATEETANWYLAPSWPGTLRLGLGPGGATSATATRPLAPGNFRIQLSAPVTDRLVRRGVQTFLNPEKPFVPEPPITVGKVLFVSIKVEQIFLRSLQSGYSDGVFRFKDLVVDVAWKAGPLSGLEPLLSATGYIKPRLSAVQPDGTRYWDWDTKIESLTIRSDKMPGNKEEQAAELIPRLEKELGSGLAQKQKISARLPLSAIVQTPATANAYIDVTDLRTLDSVLELEGKLVR